MRYEDQHELPRASRWQARVGSPRRCGAFPGSALMLSVAALTAAGCAGSEGTASSSSPATTVPAASTIHATSPASTAPTATIATTAAPASKQAGSTQAGVALSPSASADAICVRRNKELAAAGSGGATSLPAIASSAARRVAIEGRVLGELGALTPPAKVTREWRQVLTLLGAARENDERLARHATTSDAARLRLASELPAGEQLRLFVAATRAGLKHCASAG